MTTVIIKVASEVVFKALTDDIVSTVLKKATMANKVVQERLDWFSEASGVFCILNERQLREYFWRLSSVNTKSLIFVFRALGRKIAHNIQLWSERSNFLTNAYGIG